MLQIMDVGRVLWFDLVNNPIGYTNALVTYGCAPFVLIAVACSYCYYNTQQEFGFKHLVQGFHL